MQAWPIPTVLLGKVLLTCRGAPGCFIKDIQRGGVLLLLEGVAAVVLDVAPNDGLESNPGLFAGRSKFGVEVERNSNRFDISS